MFTETFSPNQHAAPFHHLVDADDLGKKGDNKMNNVHLALLRSDIVDKMENSALEWKTRYFVILWVIRL
jgi:hypothetical protein